MTRRKYGFRPSSVCPTGNIGFDFWTVAAWVNEPFVSHEETTRSSVVVDGATVDV
ncbi:hypothetical protein ACFQH8_03785 [Halomicroarcula sp. GCM10025710]